VSPRNSSCFSSFLVVELDGREVVGFGEKPSVCMTRVRSPSFLGAFWGHKFDPPPKPFIFGSFLRTQVRSPLKSFIFGSFLRTQVRPPSKILHFWTLKFPFIFCLLFLASTNFYDSHVPQTQLFYSHRTPLKIELLFARYFYAMTNLALHKFIRSIGLFNKGQVNIVARKRCIFGLNLAKISSPATKLLGKKP
jgi:hypothetical protein